MSKVNQAKIEKFAVLLHDQILARLNKEMPKNLEKYPDFWESSAKVNIVPGRKYTKVDIGGSGKYMVVNETGEIFGIKGYGVIHRGYKYGTLDTIAVWDWGGFRAGPKPVEEVAEAKPETETTTPIRIGLKSNANFLFSQMRGDTLGGTTGDPLWRSIMHLTKPQFKRFKVLIEAFGGDLDKSLTQAADNQEVDYECYFTKVK